MKAVVTQTVVNTSFLGLTVVPILFGRFKCRHQSNTWESAPHTSSSFVSPCSLVPVLRLRDRQRHRQSRKSEDPEDFFVRSWEAPKDDEAPDFCDGNMCLAKLPVMALDSEMLAPTVSDTRVCDRNISNTTTSEQRRPNTRHTIHGEI